MRFKYEAKDKFGSFHSGVIEAFSREEALQKISRQGLSLICLYIDVPKNVPLVGEGQAQTASPVSRSLGMWLLMYALLWVDIICFITFFGFALVIGDSPMRAGLLVNAFLFTALAGVITANCFLIGAGAAFIKGLDWARRAAVIGNAGVFVFAFSLLCAAILYPATSVTENILFIFAWLLTILPGAFIARRISQIPRPQKQGRIPNSLIWTADLLIFILLASYALNTYFTLQKPPVVKRGTVALPEAAHEESIAEEEDEQRGPQPTPFADSRRPTTAESLEIARELEEEAAQYYQQEKYTQALSLYRQALYIKKNLLGSTHPEVTGLLEKEEEIRAFLKDSREAEPGIESEQLPGDLADELHNEAHAYFDRKNYKEAERLLKQVLKIKEDGAGEDDISLLEVTGDLAVLYERMNRLADAEAFYKRLIGIQEKHFQPLDPRIGDSLQRLGDLYITQGRFRDASLLIARALEIRKDSKGADSVEAADSMQSLADCYYFLGNYAGAYPLSREAADIRERALGPFDIRVAQSLERLATINLLMRKDQEAEFLFKRVLTIKEDVFGMDSPQLIPVLNNLAGLSRKRNDLQEAEAIYRRTLNIKEAATQEPSIELADIFFNLGTLYRDKKRYSESESYLKKALAIRKELYDHGHKSISESLLALAQVYALQDDTAEAIPLFEEAMVLYENLLGENSPEVLLCLNELARLYTLKDDFNEAESLLLRAQGIIERNSVPGDVRLKNAYRTMAEFYRRAGREEDALKYEEKIQE